MNEDCGASFTVTVLCLNRIIGHFLQTRLSYKIGF